jgi:hypothetical protein
MRPWAPLPAFSRFSLRLNFIFEESNITVASKARPSRDSPSCLVKPNKKGQTNNSRNAEIQEDVKMTAIEAHFSANINFYHEEPHFFLY